MGIKRYIKHVFQLAACLLLFNACDPLIEKPVHHQLYNTIWVLDNFTSGTPYYLLYFRDSHFYKLVPNPECNINGNYIEKLWRADVLSNQTYRMWNIGHGKAHMELSDGWNIYELEFTENNEFYLTPIKENEPCQIDGKYRRLYLREN